MSIKIDEFDPGNGLPADEFRIRVLERLLEKLINMNSINLRLPTQQDIEALRQQTAEELKLKNPDNGIERQTM